MQISIIGDNNQEKCEVDCGVDWSSPKAIALARRQIEGRFGTEIELQYLDLYEATVNRDIPEWRQEIKTKNLSLPLLLVNDNLRISGQFDIRQLLDTITPEIEIGDQW